MNDLPSARFVDFTWGQLPLSANLVPVLWCVYGFIHHIGMGCRYSGNMDEKLRISIHGAGFRQLLAE